MLIHPQELLAPIKLSAWINSKCIGNPAYTEFSSTYFARNVSNYELSRSFMLSRTMKYQEQLDLFITTNMSLWYADKDQISYNDSSCTRFLKTYWGVHQNSCISASPFTCRRLWNNPGLKPTKRRKPLRHYLGGWQVYRLMCCFIWHLWSGMLFYSVLGRITI